ncbi:type II secretion system F family protein [Catenuloplanes sp. NPDC051500]|uniref:type II secretion system F family protein n=1 Tax=Catenuloplanes sp. NPDC051500 TaxID=3363959 RepID=UPI00379CF6BD
MRTRVLVAGITTVSALAGLLVAGPVGMLAAVYCRLAARGVLHAAATRAEMRARTQTLDALCTLAADLRAGLPRTDPPVLADPRIGRLTTAAWRLAERTGAPLADLVERIESDTRALARGEAAAAAEAAGARATAWLLAGLPAGGLVLGVFMGVDPLHVLLHTPVGAACATGAVLLQSAGLAWANRLATPGVTP